MRVGAVAVAQWGGCVIRCLSSHHGVRFEQVQMERGRIFSFGGVSRRHHNKRNNTGVSRVSLDFRVIPMTLYDASLDHERKTTRAHRFTLGEYFELVHVD
jgi:hypothetical protein